MQQEIEFIPIREDGQSSIGCRLAYCKLPSFPEESCLVAAFMGAIEDTSSHESGYGYMHAMIGAGFAACNPATVILDLRNLKYDSGDKMLRVLDQRIITKVIVSGLNRKGLTALISGTLFLDPDKELFESLPDALAGCDSAYRDFLRDGRKQIMAADF